MQLQMGVILQFLLVHTSVYFSRSIEYVLSERTKHKISCHGICSKEHKEVNILEHKPQLIIIALVMKHTRTTEILYIKQKEKSLPLAKYSVSSSTSCGNTRCICFLLI